MNTIEIAGIRTMSDWTCVAVIREYDGRLTTVTFSGLMQLISEMEEV